MGAAYTGFTYSPLALIVDAVKLSVSSADKSVVAIMATGSVSIESDAGAGSRGGATEVSTLSGTQLISNALDAAGDNINIVANETSIDAPIRSAGAVLTIAPVDRDRVIVLGHDENQIYNSEPLYTDPRFAGALYLTDSSLGNIQDGFQQVVIGSPAGYNIIQIGDKTTTTDTVIVNNPLVLSVPSLGGAVYIYDNLLLTGSSSLTVHGSGNTTHIINSDVTAGGNIDYDDSVIISGNVTIKAGATSRLEPHRPTA